MDYELYFAGLEVHGEDALFVREEAAHEVGCALGGVAHFGEVEGGGRGAVGGGGHKGLGKLKEVLFLVE